LDNTGTTTSTIQNNIVCTHIKGQLNPDYAYRSSLLPTLTVEA
jgi:hypothetical protein